MGGRSLLSNWLANVKLPDGFVHSPFPMTDEQWQHLKASDAVAALCPTTAFKVELRHVRFGATDIVPPHTLFSCFDPREFFAMTQMEWVQGNRETALARLDEGRAVLVSREYLVAHGIGLGSKLTVVTEASGPVEFDVVGVVSSPGLDVAVNFFGIHRYYADASVSTIFGTRADAVRYFHNETINLVLLRFRTDLSEDEAMARLRDHVADSMIVGSASTIRRFVDDFYNGVLGTASTVAVAMLLMACFGLGHIIIANLTSRRLEYGVLRGVGATRFLLARLIMAETLLIAAVGCVLGSGLGVQSSLIEHEFMRRLYGLHASPRIPWDVIVLGCATATVLALLTTLPAVWHLMRVHPRALLATGREG
jgi:putative ABC transport system permease protein